MQIFRKIIHLPVFLSFLMFWGCLGEGDLNCDETEAEGLTIQFLHNINPDYTNTLSTVVEFIDLYIYNESGELYKEVNLTKEELEETDYTYSTALPKGIYKLAAWMNNGDSYHKEHIESFSQADVRIKCNGNQEIFDNTDALYYGYDDRLYDHNYEEQDVTVEMDWYPVSKTINFAKNTNYIQIDAQFSRLLHEDGNIDVTIKGKNGICNFYNRPPATNGRAEDDINTYTYYPYSKDEAFNDVGYYYTHISHLTTQRLWENDEIELNIVLQEPGRMDRILVNEKLTDLIMRNPRYNNNFQLERYDTYRLVFQFDLQDGAWVVADIIVNDWHLVKQEENDLGTL